MRLLVFYTIEKRGVVFKNRKSIYSSSSKKRDNSAYSQWCCILPLGYLSTEDIPTQDEKKNNLEIYPDQKKKKKALFRCQVDLFIYLFSPNTKDYYPVEYVAGLIGRECLGLLIPAWAFVPSGDLISILDILWRSILCRFNSVRI